MEQIKLIKVQESDYKFLYELLKNRNPIANISHRKMPTYSQHKKFIESKPYKSWYVIYKGNIKTGSIYLSKQNEIGIFLLEEYQGKNIGKEALKILMTIHPQNKYLANVSPLNVNSANFFKKNKFRLIQHTYEYILDDNQ